MAGWEWPQAGVSPGGKGLLELWLLGTPGACSGWSVWEHSPAERVWWGCWCVHTAVTSMKSCPHPTYLPVSCEELPCVVIGMTTSICALPSRDLRVAGESSLWCWAGGVLPTAPAHLWVPGVCAARGSAQHTQSSVRICFLGKTASLTAALHSGLGFCPAPFLVPPFIPAFAPRQKWKIKYKLWDFNLLIAVKILLLILLVSYIALDF